MSMQNDTSSVHQFNIEPPAIRRKAATDKLVEKIVKHDSWPIQPDIEEEEVHQSLTFWPLYISFIAFLKEK